MRYPIGTEVVVIPYECEGQQRPWRALVVGYDQGHSKYRLAPMVYYDFGRPDYHPSFSCWSFEGQTFELKLHPKLCPNHLQPTLFGDAA